ncbi:hypothetical protein RC54_06020 [Herbaspirillum rubrisubalbicans]|uniref:Uncharacterized protein n=1 Tax=Herbaspirillum rubrisubalbicans TaxID=80842 RepID=A0AAD0XFE9_9BURK|nr:hypothetical protein RC54_06020 [Herbaspirillum rubrisubalbicans]
MKIRMAHLRERSTSGGWINFAVFDARSTANDNDGLLTQLTVAARNSGLQVDQSALAYTTGGRLQFYGHRNLVDYLATSFRGQWTHTIDV